MPVIEIVRHSDKSVTAVWEITETENELLHEAALSGDELKELPATTNLQRRLERLAVHALLNRAFDKKTVMLHRNNGQPFLPDNTANISVTHTQRFAAIIIHEEASAGIDMEALSRNFDAVERKALSDEECRYLSGEHRNRQLCLLWCAKETLYKLIGESGIDFAQQLFVEKFTPGQKGQLNAAYTDSEGRERAFIVHYKQIHDHMMAWSVN